MRRSFNLASCIQKAAATIGIVTFMMMPDVACAFALSQAFFSRTELSTASTSVAQTSGQTYREPTGAFTITFPEGYLFEATDTGLTFRSPDESFRGEVVFGSATGESYTHEQLETFLKAAYTENLKLTEVDWQQTEVQSNGRQRIDWVGRDPQGNVLDTESFIEQRGDTIYILTLSGINRSFQDYFEDAQAIIDSYQVREQ